jgi:hypothetical protein
MTPTYRVFVAADVIATLRKCSPLEKREITWLFDELAQNPFRNGDYIDQDPVGRPVQVILIGNRALCYWADHAVKEVKIIDLRFAGH